MINVEIVHMIAIVISSSPKTFFYHTINVITVYTYVWLLDGSVVASVS